MKCTLGELQKLQEVQVCVEQKEKKKKKANPRSGVTQYRT